MTFCLVGSVWGTFVPWDKQVTITGDIYLLAVLRGMVFLILSAICCFLLSATELGGQPELGHGVLEGTGNKHAWNLGRSRGVPCSLSLLATSLSHAMCDNLLIQVYHQGKKEDTTKEDDFAIPAQRKSSSLGYYPSYRLFITWSWNLKHQASPVLLSWVNWHGFFLSCTLPLLTPLGILPHWGLSRSGPLKQERSSFLAVVCSLTDWQAV